MSKFTEAFKRKAASSEAQQKISEKIFYNSVMKDKKGNGIDFPEPGGKYYLYSKESDKKIGWVKMPSRPGEAGYGWCNLPAYLKMEEPPEVPEEFEYEDWDEVDLDEYFDEVDVDEYLALDDREFDPDATADLGDDPEYMRMIDQMNDGTMIDDYMDLQARHAEFTELGESLAATHDFTAWKENKKTLTSIENAMKEIADQWREKYPGGEIEDIVNDMRNDHELDDDGPDMDD